MKYIKWKIIISAGACFLLCGCVMIESYFKPLPGQGTRDQDYITWNRPTHLNVDIGSQGQWWITQWLEGWQNQLHLQVVLSVDEKKTVALASQDVVVEAQGDKFVNQLQESNSLVVKHLRWEGRFVVDMGKKIYRQYTLLLPAVTIDGQTYQSKPVYFQRKKGLIFYRILQ